MTIDRGTAAAFLALCVLVPFGCDPDNDHPGRDDVDGRDAEVSAPVIGDEALLDVE